MMSQYQRYLRDDTGAVFAEWMVFTAVIITLCLVTVTALRGEATVADSHELHQSGV